MSYEELDSIRSQGIDAIINLCGEFTDLHEIEQSRGFEVFFLPIPDEHAPLMADMEGGLEWLDEAIYLGKKVLVHCRHGIGRTGTFVTAYLLRRGFSLKQAGKMMKPTRANPTNFPQWWLLRKFGKKEGRLTLLEPTPENRKADDFAPFFARYEQLLEKIDKANSDAAALHPSGSDGCEACGERNSAVELELIEALYLQSKVNITLSNQKRNELINRTATITLNDNRQENGAGSELPIKNTPSSACPLYQQNACLLNQFRPVSCRLGRQALSPTTVAALQTELQQLSLEICTAIFGQGIEDPPPTVQIADVVSGRFIQYYFQILAAHKKANNQ
jgi:hypothetical protein